MTLSDLLLGVGQILLSTQTIRVTLDPKTRVARSKAILTTSGLALLMAGLLVDGRLVGLLTLVSVLSWAHIAWRRAA